MVDAMLAGHTFTDDQSKLIERAKSFRSDTAKQTGLAFLDVPAHKRTEGGETLSPDLIDRLNLFYKFLQYEQLIDGKVKEIGSGIRAYSVAHMLSMKWTLNARSGVLTTFEGKLKFARQVVEIGGTDADGNVWLSAAGVTNLQAALDSWDSPGDCPLDGFFDEADANQSNMDPLDQAQANIEFIVSGMMASCAASAWGPPQGAQASEGYPTGHPSRRPNTREVGVSNHCGGEAIDITFPFVFNYYDPIVDAVAIQFGLYRPVKDSGRSPEHWHYERVGANFGWERVQEG